ncbi:MAG: SDR family oxidoreductase [Candidatus Cloacimonetes bacterium]|nr:SDR family oxidoreductase [Candidatus Cloacimonadota bacterium]
MNLPLSKQLSNSLEQKTIIITGASAGIGRQCAIDCSKAGACVVLIARSVDKLLETRSMLEDGNHLVFPYDLSNCEDINVAIKDIVKKVGHVHGFIHSAGAADTMPFQAVSPEDMLVLHKVNTISAFEIARQISKPGCLSPTGASFIFISSIRAIHPEPGTIAYAASKSALVSGMKVIALELAKKKVRCNCISPGFIRTDILDEYLGQIDEEEKQRVLAGSLLGLGEPIDVSRMAIFLLSDQARFITGTDIVIDGGTLLK